MKIGVYDIINNPLPQLYKIKDIDVKIEDFKEEEKIVDILNKHLKMNKLNAEHIYALGLTYGLIPKGIIQVSVGKDCECDVNIKNLAIGLLLIGAEQYMCFHNHPGYNKKISNSDIELTNIYKKVGDLIGIDLISHIMITGDYYKECKSVVTEKIFGMEV